MIIRTGYDEAYFPSITLESYDVNNRYNMRCVVVSLKMGSRGEMTLWYSYDEIVAFRIDVYREVWINEFHICENIWSQTTGKHLNWIDPSKEKRESYEEFSENLRRAFIIFYSGVSASIPNHKRHNNNSKEKHMRKITV